jgi:hypothetical protein
VLLSSARGHLSLDRCWVLNWLLHFQRANGMFSPSPIHTVIGTSRLLDRSQEYLAVSTILPSRLLDRSQEHLAVSRQHHPTQPVARPLSRIHSRC